MTEIWERFSFYGMRALLIFYLTQQLRLDDARSVALFGGYVALAYATSVAGGIIADRWLGMRPAIVTGGVLMLAGNLGLAVSSSALIPVSGMLSEQGTFFCLALLAVGTGMLKPNISTLAGRLYALDDPRRDGGFSIFYMGINIGGFVAPLICGYLGQAHGWSWGFGAAAAGMAVGLLTFWRGAGLLDVPPDNASETMPSGRTRVSGYGLVGGGVLLVWFLLQRHQLIGGLLAIVAGVSLGGLLFFAFRSLGKAERRRLFVILTLGIFWTIFWSLFELGGSALNLFADRHTDLSLGVLQLTASQTQAFNGSFIILLSPLFAMLWVRLGRAGKEPSPPAKFVIGLLLAGFGFSCLMLSTWFAGPDARVSLLWLVFAYFLLTAGELSLAPASLAMVTSLAPARIAGFVMGLWVMGLAGGNYLASLLVMQTVTGQAADGLESYWQLFRFVAVLAFVAALALLVCAPLLRRWISAPR